MMKRNRFLCYTNVINIVILLQIVMMSWMVCVTSGSRPFAPHHHHASSSSSSSSSLHPVADSGAGTDHMSPQTSEINLTSKQVVNNMTSSSRAGVGEKLNAEQASRLKVEGGGGGGGGGLEGRLIGSSPPSCEHRCYGCVPCQATQVPTTHTHTHVGIQYANYEPEGWKCKCGPSFYSP